MLARIIIGKENQLKVSELTKYLSEQGCFLVGHGAAHDKWQSSVNGKSFFVPRHPSKELKTGTVKTILKQAGVSM